MDQMNHSSNQATMPGSQWKRDALLLALMWTACTVLLMQFRPGYTFPPFELLDSWIYTSYQWDWKKQIADFGPTYYGARLSWILPGVLLHSFLPAATANICFKLCVSALLSLGCGTIVYRVRGLAAALLAVGLGVACPQIIVALHSDYVDTGVIMYAALALAAITMAKDSRWWPLWIFLAGIGFTGMTVANLSALTAPGLGIALFHLLWLRWSFKRQALSLLLYAAAAGLVIVIIDTISRRAGASTHFLKPQIDMLFYMNDLKDKNPWTPKNWEWTEIAVWLVLPVCTLLWGLFRSLVAPSPDATVRRMTLALTGGLATSLLLALILELRGMGVLSLYYYTSFHLCFAVPLLVVVGTSSAPTVKKNLLWVVITLIALLIFILARDSLAHSRVLFSWFSFLNTPQSVPILVAGILLVVTAGLVLGRLSARIPAMARLLRGELLLLGVVICSQFEGFHGREISDRLRERYRAVHAAYRIVGWEFAPRTYRYWIDGTHRDSISLASTKLWGYRLFTLKPFPEFDQPDLSGVTIILAGAPGKGAENLARLHEALAARDLEPVSPRIIPVPGKAGAGFDLVCFGMRLRPYDPERSLNRTTTSEAFASYTSAEPDPYIRHLGSVTNSPRTGELVTTERGYPVFHRTDREDHLATMYQPLTPDTHNQSREFALVIEMPAVGACNVTVQDDQFRNLQNVQLTQAGHSFYNFSVPADAKGLRVVLASYDAPETPLPTRFTLYRIKR